MSLGPASPCSSSTSLIDIFHNLEIYRVAGLNELNDLVPAEKAPLPDAGASGAGLFPCGNRPHVLKPEGKVAVIEFHKKEGPPGPPLSWRLAPEEVQAIFLNAGFVGTHPVEVGPHNYLLLFSCSPL